MYDTNIENLGKKIKHFRKAKKLTIDELGNAIGKSRATINRYENNEILPDIITAMEICNVLNIDLNNLCDKILHNVNKEENINPFNSNLIYLYYISKNGIIISSIEITANKYCHYVLMKNGLTKNKYKQEYTGVLESNYNTAFICLTNAITNPGLDKFQIEIDLHSKIDNMYYGIFLGVSYNTHKPTARKCILTDTLITSPEKLCFLYDELKITEDDIQDMLSTKYWDMKTRNIKDYVININ